MCAELKTVFFPPLNPLLLDAFFSHSYTGPDVAGLATNKERSLSHGGPSVSSPAAKRTSASTKPTSSPAAASASCVMSTTSGPVCIGMSAFVVRAHACLRSLCELLDYDGTCGVNAEARKF